ncbi:MAG TPA: prenyltransferase/squalene oxidase repeat-containing protein [Solirubrobacteraceae bacterium]|nr:prenyltransferase/squalene oxidase repeat-containing protein [Solirubrobacteraceae bacterium]
MPATVSAPAALAAQSGAAWLAILQDTTGSLGSFGGDWALTALAAAGVHPADVRTSPTDPSAQDFYASLWTSTGAGGQATDAERAILTAHAAGLDPARLDEHTNFVAQLAAQFDGHQLGGAGATNADIFGLLALRTVAQPQIVLDTLATTIRAQQNADGGWNFAYPASSSDIDVTGAAVAALCTAGATPGDPDVARALTFLRAKQDPASGGFASPFGINTDSAAWILSGLNACAIDPATWSTAQGKTPVDFLLSQQNPDGSFQYNLGDGDENLYATQDAVRALAGAGFTADPPARADGISPRTRPLPAVAPGTLVPLTLVIDSHGQLSGGSSVRMCAVTAPVGATVADFLQMAHEASAPSYCVSDLDTQAGEIARLNGIAPVAGSSAWHVSVNGAAPQRTTSATVGLGSTVLLSLASDTTHAPAPAPTTPAPAVIPSLIPAPARAPAPAPVRLALRTGVTSTLRDGRVTVRVVCPHSAGAAGCRGTVALCLWVRSSRHTRLRLHTVGRTRVQLTAGASTHVTITLDRAGRALAKTRRAPVATLVATLEDPLTRRLTSTRASTVLR